MCRPARSIARAGEAAYQCVCAATKLVQQGQADGIVTAPLSKAALHAAAHYYPGHTELLADLCGVERLCHDALSAAGRGRARTGRAGRRPCDAPPIAAERVSRSDTAAIVAKCRLADRVMRRLGVARAAAGGGGAQSACRRGRPLRRRRTGDHRPGGRRRPRERVSTWPARSRPTR